MRFNYVFQNKKRMTKMRKYFSVIFLLCGVVFIALCIRWVYTSAIQFKEAAKENIPDQTALSEEYINLFKDSIRNKLDIIRIKSNKNRNDIAFLNIESRFTIVVYKVAYTNVPSLTSVLKYKCSSDGETPDVVYHGVKAGPFEYDYAAGNSINSIQSLYVTFNTDTVQTIVKNDSFAYYSSMANKVTVCYSVSGIKDICVESTRERKIPMDILFIKHNRSIYFLIASPNNKNTSLPRGLLLSLVK
jgi:ABC-type maltose transport system permease subunit